MEKWRNVFRVGLAPHISTPALEALARALETDDQRLIQGGTTVPPPLSCVQDWLAEGGCALGFCGIVEGGGLGTATVGDVEEYFARWCFECDQELGEPAGCRHFLNWFDDLPREVAFPALLEEVRSILTERAQALAKTLAY